jgi:nucleoside phosphorylase
MFRPQALLLVGVAGALKDDINLGDVVVATKVYGYHGGNDEDDGFLTRPRAWDAPHELDQLARRIARMSSWTAVLDAASLQRLPTVHLKPIAAGEVILNSRVTPLAQQLHRTYNDAAAIEMESAGVASAGHLNRSLPVLTIRGISDKADGHKLHADAVGWQSTAAAHAAAFAIVLAGEILIRTTTTTTTDQPATSRTSVTTTPDRTDDPIAAAELPPTGARGGRPTREAGSSDRSEVDAPKDPPDLQQDWAEVWDALPIGSSLAERRIPNTPYRLRSPRFSRNSLGPLYAGTDEARHEPVSINLVMLPPDSESRFFEEVSRLMRLTAANVTSPRDAGYVVVDGVKRCLYLVLPAPDGIGVQELVERHGPLPKRATYELCLGIATALVGVHEADPPIVHGDIKPASVVVSAFGTVSVLCIGHQVSSAPTAATSQNADSFHFASPEQRDGRPLTAMTDLFALRVVLVHLLAGTHPADSISAPEAALAHDDGVRALLDRLGDVHSAVETCRVLRDALRAAPTDDPDLKSIVRPHIAGTQHWFPVFAPRYQRQLHHLDVCPIAARRAWPLGEDTVLVWELGTETLAVVRGTDLLWRDDGPLPVRKAVAGPGGRLAVAGWNGVVRCFTGGTLTARATLDGAIGDLRYAGSDLLVGAWNRALVRICDDGVARDLLAVDRGVHRIAVSDRGDRFAVADQSGGLMIYSDDRRVDTLPALGPVADIAYAGSRLVVLGDEAVAAVRLDGTRTAAVASPGAFALQSVSESGWCLLLIVTEGGPAGPVVQAWRIDEAERRRASFVLAAGETPLSMCATGRRLTVVRAGGGCAYRRDGVDLVTWSDAVSAQVSTDGQHIAVCRPGRVELFEDPR